MKKFRWDKKYLYWGVTAFCVIAASIILYMCFEHFAAIKANFKRIMTVLSPITWGLVISYILSPLLNIYESRIFHPLAHKVMVTEKAKARRASCSRAHSVAFTEITLLCFLAIFFWLIIPQLYSSIENIISNSSAFIAKANWWVDKTLKDYPAIEEYVSAALGTTSTSVIDWLQKTLLPQLNVIIANVTGGVYAVLKSVFNIIIGIIISIYLLNGKEKLASGAKKGVYAVFSLEASKKIISAVHFADRVFMGFISGKILDSIIIGLLCYICCTIMNMPYTIVVSFIVCVTNIIPYFGPFIGAIPSAIIILTMNPVKCLVFVIFILVLQQIDGNIIGPKILGSSIGVNGFWVLASITVGGGLFGFIGMLLGVPVFVLIYTAIQTTVNKKLSRSGLPEDGKEYVNIQYFDPETGNAVPRDPERRRTQGNSAFKFLRQKKKTCDCNEQPQAEDSPDVSSED